MTTGTSQTVSPPDAIRGDDFECVTIKFAVPALTKFLELLNANDIRDEAGYKLTFACRQYWAGEGVLEVTMTKPGAEVPA